MKCETCIEQKDKPLTYTRCEVCGNWRELTQKEQAKVDKRKRSSNG